MTPSAADRRVLRRGLLDALFPDDTDAALDELDRLDREWERVTGEPVPPTRVLDDVLLLSRGDLARLRTHAELAVLDPRDVHVSADQERARLGHRPDAASWTAGWSDPGAGPAAAPRRTPRRSGALRALRALAVLVALAVGLGLLVVGLQHRRDTGSRDRAWDAVGAYAAAISRETQATGSAPDAPRLVALLDEAVPVRSVRQPYFRGDLAVAWAVLGAAPEDVVICVEMRSLSGEDAYGAAWAVVDSATRSVAGGGCGPAPRSFEAAAAVARG